LVFKNEGSTKNNTAKRNIADMISCIAIFY